MTHFDRLAQLGAVMAVMAAAGAPAQGAGLRERFHAGPLGTAGWSLCQADPRLIGFAEDPGAAARRYLLNTVDEARGDAACVHPHAADRAPDTGSHGAELGPSLLPGAPAIPASTARPIQRNELRFADRKR